MQFVGPQLGRVTHDRPGDPGPSAVPDPLEHIALIQGVTEEGKLNLDVSRRSRRPLSIREGGLISFSL